MGVPLTLFDPTDIFGHTRPMPESKKLKKKIQTNPFLSKTIDIPGSLTWRWGGNWRCRRRRSSWCPRPSTAAASATARPPSCTSSQRSTGSSCSPPWQERSLCQKKLRINLNEYGRVDHHTTWPSIGPRFIGPSAFFSSVSSSAMVGASRASSPGPIAPTCLGGDDFDS